jgi:alginate O-acetyltransferase complex protein AlgI
VVDVYRNQSQAQKNPINLALYFSFFPQLIAGPIIRYHDVANQLLARTTTSDKIIYGIQRFIIGLSKKVLIANSAASIADQIFSIPSENLTMSLTWLGLICYTIQIYFDFSGYSDMAIGLAKIFGFEFLENFNYPYISKSIKEFWRRWHISLSSWFRDYLYIPLGGNRGSKFRVYFNLLLVFFLCGLWHGASWNFIVWGLWHGMFLVLERLEFGKLIERLWIPLRHIYVLVIVMIGWVFFRSDNLLYALHYLKSMIGLGTGNSILYSPDMYVNSQNLLFVIFGIIFSTPLFRIILKRINNINFNNNMKLTIMFKILSAVIFFIPFILSVISLASGTYNPFIYFRF